MIPFLQKLDINSIGRDDLEKIPGISREAADAIIRFRDEHGPFGPKDPDRIPGIGDRVRQTRKEILRS